MSRVGSPPPGVTFRVLDRSELPRVAEIDRTEHLDVLYGQHGTDLVARRGSSEPARCTYRRTGQADPRVAVAIRNALGDVDSVVTMGAGTGAYEPTETVLADEPSRMMIDQRPDGAAPAVEVVAEALPLAAVAVDAALAVLTVHHGSDVAAGVAEMRRAARRRAVSFTRWPERVADVWLLREGPARSPSTCDSRRARPGTERCRPGTWRGRGAAWRRHARATGRNCLDSPRRAPGPDLASSARPGLPGRARGTGPPNPVRRSLTPSHPGTGAGEPPPARTRASG